MASLYKRGLYWWVSFTDSESKLLGKPKGISTKKKNKRHAELIVKDFKESIIIAKNEQSYSTKAPLNDILFGKVLDRYIEYKLNDGEALTKKTISIYHLSLKRFYKALPDKFVKDYSKEDFNTFISSMSDLSQNTKSMYSSKINALFSFLVSEEYITRHYFRTVKEEVKPLKILTEKEIEKFFGYAKSSRYYDRAMLMYLGAFRASEALSITYDNIKKDSIHIVGKGGKYAVIPITDEMQAFLDTSPKFESGLKYNLFRHFFHRASVNLGFTIHSHDLRRYQLSRLANNGVNIYFVKNYARHGDIKTTLKYYAGVDMNKMRTEINQKLLQ